MSVWLERDAHGLYVWIGKVHGPEAGPDYVGRGIAGRCIGYSLDPRLWGKLVLVLIYRTRWLWALTATFALGVVVGHQKF
jgi:amino acid transporter